MNSTTQLSIFEPLFDNRIRRVILRDVTYFSVLDVYQYLSSSSNPSRDWARDVKRLERQGAVVLPKVVEPAQADDREPLVRMHQFDDKSGVFNKATPIATFRSILRIAQVAEFKNWEDLRQWMADVAHERLEENANPGLGTARAYKRDLALMERAGLSEHEAADRLRIRIDGIDTFKKLTAHIARLCDDVPAGIGATVNQEYIELFGRVAEELKVILHTKDIRNALPSMQLDYLRLAERGLITILQNKGKMTVGELVQVAQNVVKPLGEHLRMVCEVSGIDLVTGRKLLS